MIGWSALRARHHLKHEILRDNEHTVSSGAWHTDLADLRAIPRDFYFHRVGAADVVRDPRRVIGGPSAESFDATMRRTVTRATPSSDASELALRTCIVMPGLATAGQVLSSALQPASASSTGNAPMNATM